MFRFKRVKRITNQTIALIEKNLLNELRYRVAFLTRFINPLVQIIILFFIFGVIFDVSENLELGYWNTNNFTLFLILGFIFQYMRQILDRYLLLFRIEKYWKTLPALMIAPLNRFVLLLGILFTELIILSVPILSLLIIAYIFYPINLFIVFLFMVVLFSFALICGCFGLMLGVFEISNENYSNSLSILLKSLFWLSCATYPIYIFPEFIQFLIKLNPFYYFFDLLRLIWYSGVDLQITLSNLTAFHIITVIVFISLLPIISVSLFNKFYKKYGISGY